MIPIPLLQRRMPVAIITLATIIAGAPSLIGRNFEDKFGRTITAELSGHWGAGGANIQITKGGKKMKVKVSDFAAKEEAGIRKWISDNPETLVPLQDPERIGEGLISGTKWMLVSGSRTAILEFGGTGSFKMNGAVAKSQLWKTVNEGDLAFSLQRVSYLFDAPIATERIYGSSRSSNLLLKLERAPRPIAKDKLEGKTFALVNQGGVSAWSGSDKDKRIVIDLHKSGKATGGGREYKWKIEGSVISISDKDGKWHSFGAQSPDIWVNGSGSVLWQVPGPDGR